MLSLDPDDTGSLASDVVDHLESHPFPQQIDKARFVAAYKLKRSGMSSMIWTGRVTPLFRHFKHFQERRWDRMCANVIQDQSSEIPPSKE